MGTVTAYNLANVQAALGGGNPISMSEYYRGGPYVPTTGTTTVTEGPFYTSNSYEFTQTTSGIVTIYWAGSLITSGSYGAAVTSVSYGGYVYVRGAFVSGSGSSFFPRRYYISRQYSTSVAINTGVPSSGSISLSQLLGARNP
jgi:hypothetical protein